MPYIIPAPLSDHSIGFINRCKSTSKAEAAWDFPCKHSHVISCTFPSTNLWMKLAQAGAGGKDVDLSPFNAADMLLGPFCSQKHLNERINLMFQDMDLMPLFIQV